MDFGKRNYNTIDVNFLNNGLSFPGLDTFCSNIEIKNLSRPGRVIVPVHIKSQIKSKKTTLDKKAIYKVVIRITDNIISLVLLFILKILQKIVNFICSRLEKYRIEKDYSDKEETKKMTIRRLNMIS